MRRSVIGIGVVAVMLCLVAVGMGRYKGGEEVEMTIVSTERATEGSMEEIKTDSFEEEVEEEELIGEEEGETVEETRFVYSYGREYDEDKIPRRFGYVVEENIKERESPLKEEDFKQLKKGEYFYPSRSHVGKADGQIMYTKRYEGTGVADTSPYYKIDDNTYVVLFYEHNFRMNPLDHIEVWDGEGNKLREIEID